jgi:hypothetical protein
MTPDEVEVGRRNLIAELREGVADGMDVSADMVRDLIAVLEASKPTVVDRKALVAVLAEHRSIVSESGNGYDDPHEADLWCSHSYGEAMAAEDGDRPPLATWLQGEGEDNFKQVFAEHQADAVIAALYPKATEGKS